MVSKEEQLANIDDSISYLQDVISELHSYKTLVEDSVYQEVIDLGRLDKSVSFLFSYKDKDSTDLYFIPNSILQSKTVKTPVDFIRNITLDRLGIV